MGGEPGLWLSVLGIVIGLIAVVLAARALVKQSRADRVLDKIDRNVVRLRNDFARGLPKEAPETEAPEDAARRIGVVALERIFPHIPPSGVEPPQLLRQYIVPLPEDPNPSNEPTW